MSKSINSEYQLAFSFSEMELLVDALSFYLVCYRGKDRDPDQAHDLISRFFDSLLGDVMEVH